MILILILLNTLPSRKQRNFQYNGLKHGVEAFYYQNSFSTKIINRFLQCPGPSSHFLFTKNINIFLTKTYVLKIHAILEKLGA